jgi:hypothetical protein
MRRLLIGAAFVVASVSAVLADDAPAPPPADAAAPPPAETAAPPASTSTTTTTTTTTTGDPMAATYGNTLIVKGGGPESHTHYNADHTFDGIAPEYNYPYKGTWEITADGRLCRTFNPSVPTVSNPDCDAAPLAAHAVGDSWTDAKGSTVTLVAGIQ